MPSGGPHSNPVPPLRNLIRHRSEPREFYKNGAIHEYGKLDPTATKDTDDFLAEVARYGDKGRKEPVGRKPKREGEQEQRRGLEQEDRRDDEGEVDYGAGPSTVGRKEREESGSKQGWKSARAEKEEEAEKEQNPFLDPDEGEAPPAYRK